MTLENKLGLTGSAELAREEERISKKRAAELFYSDFVTKDKNILKIMLQKM